MSSKEFYVTLLSNASPGLYPGNTVTQFTNVLPKPLSLPREEKWRVCLHHLSMPTADQEGLDEKEFVRLGLVLDNANKQVEETDSTNLLNWYLNVANQVRGKRADMLMGKYCKEGLIFVRSPDVTSYTNTNILSVNAIHPYSPTNASEAYVYEPETNAYFDLTSNLITELTFEITNYHNERWTCNTAQPSILVLKFKSMFQDRNDYHTVRVTNPSFGDITDFRVALPDNLLRAGEQNPWEMALTQISFVPSFHQFDTTQTFKWSFAYAREGQSSPKEQVDFGTMEFPEQNVSVRRLLKYVVDFFAPREKVPLSFSYRKGAHNAYYLQIINTGRHQRSPVALSLPWQLTYMLGLSGIKCEINPGNIRIDVDHKMTHYATMAMDPNFLVPSNLLIYCDAIEPSSIGNTFGSYLTNISIRKDITNQMITVEPKNLEYHTVTTGDLGNVRFQLFKTDGTPPNFKNKKHQKIFMSFIFRRRNEN